MDLSRYGPWAVVTGASAGLGEEFAKRLAAAGLNLVLVARRKERLEALAAELSGRHRVEVRALALDLAREEAVAELDGATAELEVGLVVNNAGFGAMGLFLDQDLPRLKEMVRLNCLAVLEVAHRFGRRLAARGRGGLIVTASLAGFQACPYMAAYGATKGFDLLLGEGLAHEMKRHGVDLLVLCPGATRTEFGQVAGSTGGGASMEAGPVVAAALRALGRKTTLVTGLSNKAAAFLGRFFPRRALTALTAIALKPMVPPERR